MIKLINTLIPFPKKARILLILFSAAIAMVITSAVHSAPPTLSASQAAENIEFIKETIGSYHPAAGVYLPSIEIPVPTTDVSQKDFFFTAQRAVSAIGDAHTEIMYDGDLKFLPFTGTWRDDGYAVGRVFDSAASPMVDSKLISIGGSSVGDYFSFISGIVSRESPGRVFAAGEELMRWKPLIEMVTGNTATASISVSYRAGDRELTVYLPFVPISSIQEKPDAIRKLETSFDPILSAGYIRFDYCYSSDEFLNGIQAFIAEVKERKLRNMIIDLRRNGGGSTSFVSEFLMHMPGREYTYYTVVDRDAYSKMETEPPDQKKWILPHELDFIDAYSWDVFILTGPETFSSASFFASVMRENGLAIIIGEPTGNAPCAFGHAKEFPLPHGKFRLRVSTRYFIRPSAACGEDSLKPHVIVPTTAADIIAGRDPVMEWLENHMNRFF